MRPVRVVLARRRYTAQTPGLLVLIARLGHLAVVSDIHRPTDVQTALDAHLRALQSAGVRTGSTDPSYPCAAPSRLWDRAEHVI